ncbi:MAG: N-acetyl-gamma-glutamyl-phosphate reductase [Actinobacteria bacterium]|nr:N-acetyl-gamma-glutamyl-phosphate reductase [Actinomycetota bacterium]
MAKAAVIGGSGYTGAELLRLLAHHPDIEVVQVTAATNAGATVTDLYPSLGPAYDGVRFEPFSTESLSAGLDLAFVALPHGESQRHASPLIEACAHVVDIGADFRLPAAAYATWYGTGHEAPELLGQFSYGLPELFRDEIRAFPHVANPGCYPTAAILSLAPLLALGLAEPTGIVVDAVSGISGRGRSLTEENLFSEANENVSAYGLLDHRHTAEMEMALSAVAGTAAQVVFTPHVAPMTRGILATCYARPAASGLSSAGLLDHYRDFYSGEPFVRAVADPPPTKATAGANTFLVTPRFDPRTGTIVVVGALDNLVKGASGQAIQNANLLLDLAETTGLTDLGIMP